MLFFFDGLSLRLAEARDPGSNSEGRDVPIPARGSRKMATRRRHAMLCASRDNHRIAQPMYEEGSVPSTEPNPLTNLNGVSGRLGETFGVVRADRRRRGALPVARGAWRRDKGNVESSIDACEQTR